MKNPLWMPEGSVRSLIAMALIGCVIGLAVYLAIEARGEEITNLVIGGLLTSMGSAATFYFMTRQNGTQDIS